jgi:hypothetical protein
MAELAVPLIALGSMYIISKQKKNEGYSNMNSINNPLPNVNPPIPIKNFPTVEETTRENNVGAYTNPNQHTDKYSNPMQNGASRNDLPGPNYSLTGNPIDKSNFKHNNMAPFFGGKIRGATADSTIHESILDNMQGTGSQFFSKKEQAPLFNPQEGYQYANGAPNVSDFMQSRVNPSMKMANVKPWEEQRVGPGLNKGFTNDGSAGFNSGMEARHLWTDRTVDELRVATNPKMSFELQGHEGPGTHFIKSAPSTQTQGKVEKHLPEKYFASGPERWMTTTGLEKAPTARGIELLHEVNRTNTTAEYYGTRANQSEGTYVDQEHQPSRRQPLPQKDFAPATCSGTAGATTGDYGIQSYTKVSNNRSTTRQDTIMGPVGGIIKAIVSPIVDFIRPTRKEDVVDSMRYSGNPTAPVNKGQIYNPADRTKTTIREMTEADLDCNHLNVQQQNASAYLVSTHQPVHLQRDTTTTSHTGVAGPNGLGSSKSYEAEYRQRNNVNKTQELRPNQGGTQMFNQIENITIHKRDGDRDNNRWWVPSSGGTAGITARGIVENLDRVKVSQGYDQNINNDRIAPELLNAFKNNPYTQSLNSWA